MGGGRCEADPLDTELRLSAKPADCRLGTVVARQDAKVAKSAKKSREKQRLLPWLFLAILGALGVAWRDATTTRGGR
jgi:hypothetical protein